MKQKAPDELDRIQRHGFDLVVVFGVAPLKSHPSVFQAEQASVGDRHPMGVAGQVLQYICGTAKGWFGIDHPLDVLQRAQSGVKPDGLSKRRQASVKLEFPAGKSIPHQSQKLSAEESA
jgi:hypothetical protein